MHLTPGCQAGGTATGADRPPVGRVPEAVTVMAEAVDHREVSWHPAPLSVEQDRGRSEVLEGVFRAEYQGLLRLAVVIVGDRPAAEDVVMEAFCALHRNWGRVRDREAPLGYLRSAIILASRSHLRRLARERRRPRVWDVGRPDPSGDDALGRRTREAVLGAVRALPTRQREVIVCRYYLDLSEPQTADLLQISVGAVKRHAHRARGALADRLEVES